MALMIAIVNVLVTICVAGSTAQEATVDSDSVALGRQDGISWSALTFRAEKLLLSAETVVSVDSLASDQLASELWTFPEDPGTELHGDGAAITKLRLRTDLPFGRSETATVWISSVTGAALQGEKVVHGRRPYWKLWRYGHDRIIQWRAEPLKPERDQPVTEWSKRKVESKELPGVSGEIQAVTDSYALLYVISNARLDAIGDTVVLHTISHDRLVELELEVTRAVSTEVQYERVSDQETGHRSGLITAWEVSGTGRYVGDNEVAGDVDTGLMGIRGALTILLEQSTGIPVQVSGRARNLGKITVNLTRVRSTR